MKRSRGPHSKCSRGLTAPPTRDTVTMQLREFTPGQCVRLEMHARFPSRPPLKFNHRIGKVEAKLSRFTYRVCIPDMGARKHFDVRNVHLQPVR